MDRVERKPNRTYVRKYTKKYLKFAVNSISFKRNKATVKVYGQYLDGTNAFYKALFL